MVECLIVSSKYENEFTLGKRYTIEEGVFNRCVRSDEGVLYEFTGSSFEVRESSTDESSPLIAVFM